MGNSKTKEKVFDGTKAELERHALSLDRIMVKAVAAFRRNCCTGAGGECAKCATSQLPKTTRVSVWRLSATTYEMYIDYRVPVAERATARAAFADCELTWDELRNKYLKSGSPLFSSATPLDILRTMLSCEEVQTVWNEFIDAKRVPTLHLDLDDAKPMFRRMYPPALRQGIFE